MKEQPQSALSRAWLDLPHINRKAIIDSLVEDVERVIAGRLKARF